MLRQAHRLRRSAVWLAVICCAAAGPSRADAPFSIDAYAIDNAGAITMNSSCSRLTASVGQTATGFSTGGGFSLSSGYQAIAAAAPGDTIFFSGFEGCQP